MNSDFLTDLDAALNAECACRCGRPILASSPSAYFASEACSERYYWRPRIEAWKTRATVELAAACEAFREFVTQLARQLDPLVRAFRRLAKLFRMVEPPVHPYERALWARGRRGTGPIRIGQVQPARRVDPLPGFGNSPLALTYGQAVMRSRGRGC